MLVAIDGPAGAGKSTVARAVARALGFTYLDTGAMYRAAALAGERGGDPAGELDIHFEDGRTFLGTEDVSTAIRAPEISRAASVVAARPEVRERVVALQRALIAAGDWVAEGRDIGTVVAPDAEVKVYLTASAEERARRRAGELGGDPAKVMEQLRERDHRDSEREVSPLRRAPDATELDSTGMDIDEVVRRIVSMVPR